MKTIIKTIIKKNDFFYLYKMGYATDDPEICVEDFTNWITLENKINRRYIRNDLKTRYVHADDYSDSSVRMVIIVTSNEPATLYYCINNKGNPVMPKYRDPESEEPPPDYKVVIEKNVSIG